MVTQVFPLDLHLHIVSLVHFHREEQMNFLSIVMDLPIITSHPEVIYHSSEIIKLPYSNKDLTCSWLDYLKTEDVLLFSWDWLIKISNAFAKRSQCEIVTCKSNVRDWFWVEGLVWRWGVIGAEVNGLMKDIVTGIAGIHSRPWT
jgi:hypothetical protein